MEKTLRNDRATKKQRELLSFVDGFVKGNGYGPSYREIMRALEYKSVSTVAAHINGLIAKGYLEKVGDSARSLTIAKSAHHQPTKEEWLAGELRKQRTKLVLSTSERDRATVDAIDTVAHLFDISL